MRAFLLQLLARPEVLRFGWALLHFFWQGFLIAGLVKVLFLLAGERRAVWRYGICGAAMAFMPICLLGTFLAPVGVGQGTAASSVSSSVPGVSLPAEGPSTGESRLILPDLPEPSLGCLSWSDLNQYMPLVVTLWFAGVMLLALRKAGGFVVIGRLRRRGIIAPSDELMERFQKLCRRWGIDPARVSLKISCLVHVPMTMGWLRPVVLFPAVLLSGLSAGEIELLLAHELAHIRRYDYIANILQTMVETLFFYHPAVWWISCQMRQEREHCCDDLITTQPDEVLAYAKVLMRLETIRPSGSWLVSAANGGSLLRRVQRLTWEPTPVSASGLPVILAGTALLAIIATFSLVQAQIKSTSTSSMSEAEARQKGIATLVNGTPIYWSDLTDDDGRKKPKTPAITRDIAIERELVIQGAEASGYQVPPSVLEERIAFGVKGFGGDKEAFVHNLEKNGSSLKKFNKRNWEDAMYTYLWTLKVYGPAVEAASKPNPSAKTPEEAQAWNQKIFTAESNKLTEALMADLYAKAVIQRFPEPIAASVGAEGKTRVTNLPVPSGLGDAQSKTAPTQIKISIVIRGADLKDWTQLRNNIDWTVSAPIVPAITLENTIKDNDEGVAENIRKFPYPIGFDPPERVDNAIAQGKKVSTVIPMTPTEFKTEGLGWSFALVPKINNGLVQLNATATCTTMEMRKGMGVYGENTGPIYSDDKDPVTGKTNHVLLTANNGVIPAFQKSVTPFFIFAQPGKEYVVKLQYGSDWVDATIKCELL